MRRTIRSAVDNAPLRQLGAGTRLIPSEKEKALRALPMPNAVKALATRGVLYGVPFVCMGWGVQSPMQNRVTGAMIIALMATAYDLQLASTVGLRTATTLIAARIQAIIKAVELDTQTAGEDVSPDGWERTVLGPIRDLIDEMQTLSDCWQHCVALGLAYSVECSITFMCLTFSPLFAQGMGKLSEHIGFLLCSSTLRLSGCRSTHITSSAPRQRSAPTPTT